MIIAGMQEEDIANAAEIYPAMTLFARLDVVSLYHQLVVGNWAPSAEAATHFSKPLLRLDARHYRFSFCASPGLQLGYSLLRAMHKKSGLNSAYRQDGAVWRRVRLPSPD
uniref:hypothetical protein n=1 Tax=Cupriavidus yeoncheonensis TaxID=1462994 RepID=UPI003F496506